VTELQKIADVMCNYIFQVTQVPNLHGRDTLTNKRMDNLQ